MKADLKQQRQANLDLRKDQETMKWQQSGNTVKTVLAAGNKKRKKKVCYQQDLCSTNFRDCCLICVSLVFP
jgi:hypothetical protein